MTVVQSLPVDVTKFKDEGLASVSHDITLLKEYLRSHPKSLYATPQLVDQEQPKSIIVLRMKRAKKEVLMTMINPLILSVKEGIAVEETQDGVEGTYLNIRYPQLHIAYVGLPDGKPLEVTLTGKSALVFQQALRLTQGITIDLFGLRVDDYPEYLNGTDEEKQEIVKAYIEQLDEIRKTMQQDEDVQEYLKATDFMSQNVQNSINDELKEEAMKIIDAANALKEEEKKDESEETGSGTD